MILVTGATGQLGRAVIHHLLNKIPANQIAALVRDAAKAADLQARGVHIRVGNYDDPESLEKAMQGVAKVLLISSTDEGQRLRQHHNVVVAAQKVGVHTIAYTSRNLRDRATLENALMDEHFQTEEDIRASGLTFVIFRNALYMDAVPLFIGGARVFETGIRLPAGHGKVAYAFREDLGEAIANALLASNGVSRCYKLTGAEAWSFDDVAAALTELSGREVAYTSIDAATYEAQLTERGIPRAAALKFIGFVTDIKNGQEDEVTPELEQLLGRQPVSLKAGLKTFFG